MSMPIDEFRYPGATGSIREWYLSDGQDLEKHLIEDF